ncbi:MAG: hypothetical protein ACYTFK_13680 [Planctomycetota bacterium]
MADDPITVDSSEKITIRDGLVKWRLTCSGPADYDATNGAAFDVSSYVTEIWDISFNSVTAKADALVLATYVNDDFDDADGGAVYFTWSGTAGAVLANVDDTTNLSTYQWQVVVEGHPA